MIAAAIGAKLGSGEGALGFLNGKQKNLRGRGLKETGKTMASASDRPTDRLQRKEDWRRQEGRGVSGVAEDRDDCNLKVAWAEGEMTEGR